MEKPLYYQYRGTLKLDECPADNNAPNIPKQPATLNKIEENIANIKDEVSLNGAECCPRYDEHKYNFKKFSRVNKKYPIQSSMLSTPIERVPIFRQPIPIKKEDLNSVSSKTKRKVKKIWTDIQNKLEKNEFNNAQENLLDPLRPQKGRESMSVQSRNSQMITSPIYSKKSSSLVTQKSTKVNEKFPGHSNEPQYLGTYEPYGIDGPPYGHTRFSWGQNYRKHFESPTLSSLLRAKDPIFLQDRIDDEVFEGHHIPLKSAAPKCFEQTKKRNSVKEPKFCYKNKNTSELPQVSDILIDNVVENQSHEESKRKSQDKIRNSVDYNPKLTGKLIGSPRSNHSVALSAKTLSHSNKVEEEEPVIKSDTNNIFNDHVASRLNNIEAIMHKIANENCDEGYIKAKRVPVGKVIEKEVWMNSVNTQVNDKKLDLEPKIDKLKVQYNQLKQDLKRRDQEIDQKKQRKFHLIPENIYIRDKIEHAIPLLESFYVWDHMLFEAHVHQLLSSLKDSQIRANNFLSSQLDKNSTSDFCESIEDVNSAQSVEIVNQKLFETNSDISKAPSTISVKSSILFEEPPVCITCPSQELNIKAEYLENDIKQDPKYQEDEGDLGEEISEHCINLEEGYTLPEDKAASATNHIVTKKLLLQLPDVAYQEINSSQPLSCFDCCMKTCDVGKVDDSINSKPNSKPVSEPKLEKHTIDNTAHHNLEDSICNEQSNQINELTNPFLSRGIGIVSSPSNTSPSNKKAFMYLIYPKKKDQDTQGDYNFKLSAPVIESSSPVIESSSPVIESSSPVIESSFNPPQTEKINSCCDNLCTNVPTKNRKLFLGRRDWNDFFSSIKS